MLFYLRGLHFLHLIHPILGLRGFQLCIEEVDVRDLPAVLQERPPCSKHQLRLLQRQIFGWWANCDRIDFGAVPYVNQIAMGDPSVFPALIQHGGRRQLRLPRVATGFTSGQ